MDRLEASWRDIPPITRTWVTATVIISLLCFFDVLSPFHLLFDYHYVIRRKEWWRVVTSFLYFGPFGIDFVFHMFFLSRYCRLLEEGSFRSRPADFALLLLYASGSILSAAVAFPGLRLRFLGGPLSFVLVYIWSRRNPFIRMSFLGLLNFNAPYLPWVLLAFSTVVNDLPIGDVLGAFIGHLYWFFEDVYPLMLDRNGRRRLRIFKAPRFMKAWFRQVDPEDILDVNVQNEPPIPPDLTPSHTAPVSPLSSNDNVIPESSTTHESSLPHTLPSDPLTTADKKKEEASEKQPAIDPEATSTSIPASSTSIQSRRTFAHQTEEPTNVESSAAESSSSTSTNVNTASTSTYWGDLGAGNRLG